MPKQIRFYDAENQTHCGGILMDDGSVICGCCGGIFEADDLENVGITIEHVYDHWVDLSEEILGDDNLPLDNQSQA